MADLPVTKAPWASAAGGGNAAEDQAKLLQEKLAKARALRPDANTGGAPSIPSAASHTAGPPSSPSQTSSEGRWPMAEWPAEPASSTASSENSNSISNSGGKDLAADVPVTRIQVGDETREFRFHAPTKRIKTKEDLKRFQASPTYVAIQRFITALNDCCKGRSLKDDFPVSERCLGIEKILQVLSELVDRVPPIQQPMRYGNKAFRDWMDLASKETPPLVAQLLGDTYCAAAVEVTPYLLGSFGDSPRIDYGTGHEHSFLTFLAALHRIGLIKEEDFPALALRVFWEYLKLVRKLQLTYKLEPAGSHGCWSLDDYQMVPFMWGSSQLVGHPSIQPSSIHDARMVKQYADDYYYMHCVKFIGEVKSGTLAENSPMINDISGCTTWQRVNGGMLKMYFAEVMDKLPVIQHLLFGSIFPAP